MEVKRDRYLGMLVSRRWNGRVKILAGIRGCGKSHLLSAYEGLLLSDGVPPERIIRFDLEGSGIRNASDLCRRISDAAPSDSSGYHVLIDDIQTLPDFTDVVTTLAARRHIDACVTGRFSNGLCDGVPTECRGRGDVIRVHPLGFSEFLSAHTGRESEAWKDYLEYGGMPGVLHEDTAEGKRGYLDGLLADILSDMRERHRIGNPEAMSAVIDEIRSSVGTPLSPSGISDALRRKGLNMTNDTVRRYLAIAADSFLLEEVRRIDIRTWRGLGSPSRFYMEDVGFCGTGDSASRGENIVFSELRRRRLSVNTGVIETRETVEGVRRSVRLGIDFVAEKADRRYYIQYAEWMSDEGRLVREKRPFRCLRDGFRRALILGDDMLPHMDEEGVLNIGVRQFLLDERSLDYRAGRNITSLDAEFRLASPCPTPVIRVCPTDRPDVGHHVYLPRAHAP
ncbi:MAG: AAA family ATPase [Thermoplasmata archaeon]|nr:AAA family ATPase [Thermoplasmata archaeon]